MSLQAALELFQAVRRDAGLRARMAALGAAATTADLVALAAELGLACSEEDLQAAFRHDWVMRWVHHAGRSSGC